jgi:hypothetical protein
MPNIKKTVIAKFQDLLSGGILKVKGKDIIYMETAPGTSRDAFKEYFGFDPLNTYCDCCGKDFCISEFDSLENATHKERTRDRDENGKIPNTESYIKKRDIQFVSLREQILKKSKNTMSNISKVKNKALNLNPLTYNL